MLLAQVSSDAGKQVIFASVAAEAKSRTWLLRRALQGLRETPVAPITVLIDGVDAPNEWRSSQPWANS